ncbi:MAG: pseudouridine-5'-phosphate glycosidase [Candidatus Cloacimonetes bacterium]|nr:pseudouridine-5'-phosphate glycosidase [Candidatus Cloacimonadota bacterium]
MLFKLSTSYKKAKEQDRPILAFESAIITHGLPYPENIDLIHDLNILVDYFGVYLAVFWLDDGFVKVGFEENELAALAAKSQSVKVSSRDIPFVLAKKLTGGTTVAATIHLSHQLGLSIFATGGLGGVHYGAEYSFDISNDLAVLSKTPMIVISAGVKSVLDIAKTLEMMETLGIPVYGYQTNKFPLFYTRDSDYEIKSIDSVSEIVNLHRYHQQASLSSAMLIANPVPERWSIPQDRINKIIREALEEAEKLTVSGQMVTPYLLKKLSESDLGTVQTNLELVKNNVSLACEIALEIAQQSPKHEQSNH